MLDLPWSSITVAGGGWTLFGAVSWAVLRSLFTGSLVTRREAEGYIERAEKAEANVERLIGITAETTAVGKLQKKFAEAAIETAEGGPCCWVDGGVSVGRGSQRRRLRRRSRNGWSRSSRCCATRLSPSAPGLNSATSRTT